MVDHQNGANHPLAPSKKLPLWVKTSGIVALILLGMICLGFVWLMSSLPRTEGRIAVKGINTPTQIARNSDGIAFITARSVADAYYALGYVHAQDRLWQMELTRRIGHGRLSEIVGEAGLPTDRFMRLMGLGRLAIANVAHLEDETRLAMQSYADGINGWASMHRHRLPLEFSLLGADFEPWEIADSLVIGRLMALQLTNNWHEELLLDKLGGLFSPQQLRELFPAYPNTAPTSIGQLGPKALHSFPDSARPRLASNSWVISGRHTQSGAPLLANDPHLDFQAPVQWYLADINGPGLKVSGATIPGIPFHLIGHNGRIAWGITATHADTVDFVLETLDAQGTNSLAADGAHPLVIHHEQIRIKGGQTQDFTLRWSVNGPLISDIMKETSLRPHQAVAMKATFMDPVVQTAQSFYKLNRALNWQSFVLALQDFHTPVQNISYADMSGNIGFITVGNVPIRSWDGIGIIDGEKVRTLWSGYVPYRSMPRSYNPVHGMIINANNKVTPEYYGYDLGRLWPEPYRAQRAREMLAAKDRFSVSDMAKMQMDAVSLPALLLKDKLARLDLNEEAQDWAKRLGAWNGEMRADSPEALVFNVWMRRLWVDIFQDDLGVFFDEFKRVKAQTLLDTLDRNSPWCDRKSTDITETCQQILTESFEAALAETKQVWGKDWQNWKWGSAHRAHFDHPILGKVPLIGGFANLSIATPGDDFTLNRGSIADDFSHIHGPGLRAIFDLRNLAQSQFMISTGQSGHPHSRHYGNFLKRWQQGDYLALRRSDREMSILVLDPSSK